MNVNSQLNSNIKIEEYPCLSVFLFVMSAIYQSDDEIFTGNSYSIDPVFLGKPIGKSELEKYGV